MPVLGLRMPLSVSPGQWSFLSKLVLLLGGHPEPHSGSHHGESSSLSNSLHYLCTTRQASHHTLNHLHSRAHFESPSAASSLEIRSSRQRCLSCSTIRWTPRGALQKTAVLPHRKACLHTGDLSSFNRKPEPLDLRIGMTTFP